LAALREKMTENAKPVMKKGTAAAMYMAVNLKKLAGESASETGIRKTTKRTRGMATVLIKHSRDRSREVGMRLSASFRMYANTPPAPNPSSAMEIARKAK